MDVTPAPAHVSPEESKPRRAGTTPPGYAPGAEVSLPPRLLTLLDGGAAPDARQLLLGVFATAVRLRLAASAVRSALERYEPHFDVRPLAAALHVDCQYLLSSVDASAAADADGPLAEALDAVSFALGHEARRAFADDYDPRGRCDSARHARGWVVRACSLLENCLLQSVVTLAQALDATVTAEEVFRGHGERREQSLVLHAELSSLVERVRAVEGASGEAHPSALGALGRFRREYMHLLMYRDWEEFERFADEAQAKRDSPEELGLLLHAFARYLEALLGHVRLRAALSEAGPDGR